MADKRLEEFYKYAEEYPDGKRFLPLDVLKEMFSVVYPNGTIDDYPVPATKNVNADGVVCEAIVYTDATKGKEAKWAHAAADRVTALPDDIEENNSVTPQAAAQAAAVRKALACVGIALPVSEVYKNYRTRENKAPEGNSYTPPATQKENVAVQSAYVFPTANKPEPKKEVKPAEKAPVAEPVVAPVNIPETPSVTAEVQEAPVVAEVVETTEENVPVATEAAAAEDIAVEEENNTTPENQAEEAVKPKRKRRTKAEMEAARAAQKEAELAEEQNYTTPEEQAEEPTADAEDEASVTETDTNSDTEETEKPKRKRRTKAEMEAARAAEATAVSAETDVKAPETTTPAPATANGDFTEYEKELLAKTGCETYEQVLEIEVKLTRAEGPRTLGEIAGMEVQGQTLLMFMAKKGTRMSQTYPNLEYAARLVGLREGLLTEEQIRDHLDA